MVSGGSTGGRHLGCQGLRRSEGCRNFEEHPMRESALTLYQAYRNGAAYPTISVTEMFLSPLPSSLPHSQESMAKERCQPVFSKMYELKTNNNKKLSL